MNDPQAEGHMASYIERRKFLATLGAAAWPLAARAQQSLLPVVGVLRPNPEGTDQFCEPSRRYMGAAGWEEGRNIGFLVVWAEGRNQRAPALAEELVGQNVDLIITFGDPAIRAVQRVTQAIPIVGMTDDMIGSGLAASLARPGGNTTGVSILASELDVKRLNPARVRAAGAADSRAGRPEHDLDPRPACKRRARSWVGACGFRSPEPGRDRPPA